MNLLFKPDADGYATQLKAHYPSIQKNLDFESIKGFIEQSQLIHIPNLLGKDEYESLAENFQANTLSTEQTALLPHVQRALVYYILSDNFEFIDIFFSAAGLQQANSQETTQLPQWKYKSTLKKLYDSADTFAEQLLRFLEQNQEDYLQWVESPAYTFATELIINSAEELNNYLPVNASRRLFLRLRPFIIRIERDFISANISKALFELLKTEKKNNTLSEPNKIILPLITEATAFLAFSKSLPTLSISQSAEGYSLVSYNDGIIEKSTLDPKTKKELQAQYLMDAEQNLLTVKKILDENIDEYSTYAASSQYTEPTEENPRAYQQFDNEGRKNFTF
jgi:hypothetical protein